MGEGNDIGWDWDERDIEDDMRDFDDPGTEFDQMLAYHDMDRQDFGMESGNSQRQLWWNFRKFGKGKYSCK